MEHWIFRPRRAIRPEPIEPFPMQEPQRGQCIRIICLKAAAFRLAPAQLVCRNSIEDKYVKEARSLAVKEIFASVDDVSIRMVAHAFRRDPSTIRSWINHKPTKKP